MCQRDANFEGEKRREFIFFVVVMVALFSVEEEPFDVMTYKKTMKECT